ncbi:MAG: hypothetical protein WC972_03055 [Trueperaceae bacterium]|jgi:hypothetical protein
MANTPQQPTGSVVALSLPEDAELYVCAASNTLSSGDLVPNTSGDMDAEPTRQITRTPLHNGLDFVSLGNLQSQDFTIKAFLADNNTKLQEIKTALKNGDAMKMNIFFRDGSGVKGYAYVTRIKTQDDPTANEFSKDITFSPYGVELMDA